MFTWPSCVVAAGAVLFVTGCGRPDRGATERTFEVTGVVRAPLADGRIVIEHEEIPGFMPAMTMPFFARDEPDIVKLRAGDRVRFRFVVGDTSSRAEHFEWLGHADEAVAGVARREPRLHEGDAVPSFSLVDQNGAAVGASDLAGKRTVLTFIFTRCPVPEFCPLTTEHFAQLQSRLQNDPQLQEDARLWCITLDPEHDQPAVLRDYGIAHGADFTRWRFLTGDPAELQKLRQWFAVHAQAKEGTVEHTLATALVGRDGRVTDIWRGNRWTTSEVMDALNRAGPGQVTTGGR